KVLKLAGDLIGLEAKLVTTVDDGKEDTESEGNEAELLKLLNDVKVPEGDDEDVSFDDDEQQEQPATAPPQQQQQQPTAVPPDGSAVMKRLTALAPHMKAALAGKEGTRVQTLFAAVNGLVKHDDFTQAAKVLDELEPLVNQPADTTLPSGDEVIKR